MKKIISVCTVILFAHAGDLLAEGCSSFAKSKVFPTTDVAVLRMVKQKAESCLVYYDGFVAAIKSQKEFLLEEMTREPKNKAVRRLFEKADKEFMLAVAVEVNLSNIKKRMEQKIEDLYDPEFPRLRTEM
jgi:hypothetical protein